MNRPTPRPPSSSTANTQFPQLFGEEDDLLYEEGEVARQETAPHHTQQRYQQPPMAHPLPSHSTHIRSSQSNPVPAFSDAQFLSQLSNQAVQTNLHQQSSLPPLPRPPPAKIPHHLNGDADTNAVALAPPNSALPAIDIPSLIRLFVEYFPSLYPDGCPSFTTPNGQMEIHELKQRPQWTITYTLSRFFHLYRKRYIDESDVRHYSRVVLDYPSFCHHVRSTLPGIENEMEKHAHAVLACLQCALHHTCTMPGGPMPTPIANLNATQDDDMYTRAPVDPSAPPRIDFALPQLIVRFRDFRPVTPLKTAVKAISLGRFVSVHGTVVRTAPTRPAVKRMEFKCPKCKHVKVVDFKDNIYQPPNGCEAPCQVRFLEPDRLTAQCVDQQVIKIQEILHNANYSAPSQSTLLTSNGSTLTEVPDPSSAGHPSSSSFAHLEDHGRVPRTLEVLLQGADMVDSVIPGDIVHVCGFIKSRKQEQGIRGRNASVFVLYMEANGVDKAGSESQTDIALTEEYANKLGAKKEEDGTITTRVASPSPSRSPAAIGTFTEFTPSELSAIQQLAESSQTQGINLLKMLVASICPTIFGHESVKAGLLLALLGGVTKQGLADQSSSNASTSSTSGPPTSSARSATDPSGATSVRGDIHILIVGDPGLGKSQMLRAASKVSPRGVYISGGVTSKTGLTVTMVRDGKDGDFALEAGALVLADQGCCCIDEFDKMTAEHNALLEAMEQQSISIAKAGMVCNLAARTSVIAAANPVGGHYNHAKTVSENLKIGSPLLSRFDLVFIILDQPNTEKDQMLSEHIIQFHGASRRTSTMHGAGLSQRSISIASPRFHEGESFEADSTTPRASSSFTSQLLVRPTDTDVLWRQNDSGEMEVDLLPIPLVRKYIAYAKKYCKPLLSAGARQILASFYLSLRRDTGSTIPITTRQLESLIRLSEARAKADLCEIVTARHAEDVVELLKSSMRGVEDSGGFGGGGANGLGSNSTDRSHARGGMSKAALKKKFVTVLRRKAELKMEPIFTAAELYTLHEECHLKSQIDDFGAFIDSLNTENYLLKVGPKRYKLMAASS